MKKILYIFFVLFIGCSQKADRVRLVKIGVTHGPTHSFTQALRDVFKPAFEEQTNGRYKVRVYYSSQIGSEKEMQEMLTIGTLEMTITGLVNTYEPLFAVFEMPYLYRDRHHVMQVNNGPIMQNVAQSLIPKGMRLVGFVENGYRNITNSKRPINSPTDVIGLKIRTPENPAQIETFNALGAIPTPLSFSELYTALLQGVVDGQENPLQNIWYGRLYEAQKHVAKTHHIYNSAYVLVSERFWQDIPKSDQKILQECVNKTTQWQLNYMTKLDTELEEKLKEKGMQFTYPNLTEFEQACEPAYQAIYKKLGQPAKDIVQKIKN